MNQLETTRQNYLILENSHNRGELKKEETPITNTLQTRIEDMVTTQRGFKPRRRIHPSGLGFSRALLNCFRQELGFENIFDVYSNIAQMEVRDREHYKENYSEIGQREHMEFLSKFLIDEQAFLKKRYNFKGLKEIAHSRNEIAHLGYKSTKDMIRLKGEEIDNI